MGGNQNMRTPQWLFDLLNERFGPFKLDAFASKDNALCERYYTKETDALDQPWEDVTFANPPFHDMGVVVEKAVEEASRGIRSVVLGPVGCSQRWYHDFAIEGTIYMPDRRINYDKPNGTPTKGADRDTIVMAFGREHNNPCWVHGAFRVQGLPIARAKTLRTGEQ